MGGLRHKSGKSTSTKLTTGGGGAIFKLEQNHDRGERGQFSTSNKLTTGREGEIFHLEQTHDRGARGATFDRNQTHDLGGGAKMFRKLLVGGRAAAQQ